MLRSGCSNRPKQSACGNEENLARINADMALLTFPMQCRQRLDKGEPLPDSNLQGFWEKIQGYSQLMPPHSTAADPSPVCLEDSVCGGIAVLIAFHREWLQADQTRIDWCRAYMDEVVGKGPRRSFDCPDAVGRDHWDAFLAESGVRLLAESSSDPLARKLVAYGVAGFHYSTTALTMERAFVLRERLGDDFGRMQALAIRWAGVRMLLTRAGQLRFELEVWVDTANRLIEEFIAGSLSATPPRSPM